MNINIGNLGCSVNSCLVLALSKNWDRPVLSEWIEQFVNTVQAVQTPVQIVAHSFGCLTSVAALAEHPELQLQVKKLILVAPANPARFGEAGFARHSLTDYKDYFHQLKINVPATLLISENDPWLDFLMLYSLRNLGN